MFLMSPLIPSTYVRRKPALHDFGASVKPYIPVRRDDRRQVATIYFGHTSTLVSALILIRCRTTYFTLSRKHERTSSTSCLEGNSPGPTAMSSSTGFQPPATCLSRVSQIAHEDWRSRGTRRRSLGCPSRTPCGLFRHQHRHELATPIRTIHIQRRCCIPITKTEK